MLMHGEGFLKGVTKKRFFTAAVLEEVRKNCISGMFRIQTPTLWHVIPEQGENMQGIAYIIRLKALPVLSPGQMPGV